jgi:hypothetical protein
MKNTLRQVLVVITVLLTITVNGLANALPINGMNTGQISDRFHVLFVPAGYVFSIWGVIYLGLLAYAVFQALPSQKENPRLQATGWWVVLGGLANSIWIFLWHYLQFVGTLAAMLVLLATLIAVYLGLGSGRTKVGRLETWMARVPMSIYLGWITVATVANGTDVLDFIGWNRFGLGDLTWFYVVLGAVLVIASLMSLRHRDVAYILVILWALVGIAYKFSAQPPVSLAALGTGALVAIGLAYALLRKAPRKA